MFRPTLIGTRHEIFALTREGIKATLLLGLVWSEKPLIASSWSKLPLLVGNQELLESPQPAKNAHSSEWSVKTTSRVPVPSLRRWGSCMECVSIAAEQCCHLPAVMYAISFFQMCPREVTIIRCKTQSKYRVWMNTFINNFTRHFTLHIFVIDDVFKVLKRLKTVAENV